MKKQNQNQDPTEVQKSDQEDLRSLVKSLMEKISRLEGDPDPRWQKAEDFAELLSTPPRVVAELQGRKYVPVDHVETSLDELFNLRWQTRNVTWRREINSILVSLELGVFHPVWKEWIWRTGTGAKQLQWTSRDKLKQLGIPYDLTDLNQMIPNCIEKVFPAAEAMALKNAAKKFGEIFGRKLERKFVEDFNPLSDTLEQRDLAVTLIRDAKSREALEKLWRDNSEHWKENEFVMKEFQNKSKEFPEKPKNAKK